MTAPVRCAAAILAGGRATRMGGRQKAFLTFEGRRIIDRQLDVLHAVFGEIWIGANDPEVFVDVGLPVVPDLVADVGPLGGLLAVIEASFADHIFVVACDMPFIVPDAVRLIAHHPDTATVIVPVIDGRPEPLFARYGKAAVPAIRSRLASGDRKTTAFHSDVSVRVVTEEELRAVDPMLQSLINVNRPEDLR
jgi:molybdopterin-guanine dinucleotide biosynthesis protein A